MRQSQRFSRPAFGLVFLEFSALSLFIFARLAFSGNQFQIDLAVPQEDR